MRNIIYVKEVAERVRGLEGNVTLLGKRNFTSFEDKSCDLIFHSLPIKCPRKVIDSDDLIIPLIQSNYYSKNPLEWSLKIDIDEFVDGIFSYNSFIGNYKSKEGPLLRFILLNESSGGFDITKLCSSEVNEKVLEDHGYLDEIRYLRGDFNLNYTGFLNFPNSS